MNVLTEDDSAHLRNDCLRERAGQPRHRHLREGAQCHLKDESIGKDGLEFSQRSVAGADAGRPRLEAPAKGAHDDIDC